MASTVVVDTGFVAALLRRRDTHHAWAAALVASYPPPWSTCEAVLSEAFFLLGEVYRETLSELMRRGALSVSFSAAGHVEPVLELMRRYESVPMSFADACLVRMTEIEADPVVLTTDSDFSIYRRLGRRVVPHVLPG